MKNNIPGPLKRVKKVIERVTGYKITVSRTKSKKSIENKMNETALLQNMQFTEDELLLDEKRNMVTNIIKRYEKNDTYRRNVNYANYYETLDIRENYIMYESFHGKNISCNPYAIFKTLVKDPKFSHFHHVWVLNDLNNCPPSIQGLPNVEFVEVHSDQYLAYLASCKYLINNTSFPPYFIKKEGQVYTNTWHGTPLKTLGKDMKGTIGQHKNLMRNFLHTDYIIAPNSFTAEKMIDSHDLRGIYQGKIAETGYPRMDLVQENNLELKSILGCPEDKKVLLYAPTWRGEVGNVEGEINKFLEDAKILNEKVGNEYTILLKVHSLMQSYIKDKKINLNLVPDSVDTNELLSFVDLLITDYSSIFFDFMVTKKPIIFYAYDRADYEKDRGFYLKLEDMPGSICYDIDELVKEIGNADAYETVHSAKLEANLNKFAGLEVGKSTQRVISLIFDQDDKFTYTIADNKTNILLYSGGFLNNGVTTSAINLLNNLDYGKYNVIVADKENYDEESVKNHSKLNANVKKYYRTGSLTMLFDEEVEQTFLFRRGAEQFYKNGPQNYLDEKIINIYRREYKRMFGNSKIDIAIDFSGYVKFWTLLVAANDFNKKIIFQHNEMMEEYNKVIDGKFKHKGNFNVIFPVYNYFDYVASVAKHTRDKNRRELEHLVMNNEEKMIYVHNSINYKYVLNALNKRTPQLMKNESTGLFEKQEIPVPNKSVFNFVTMGRMSPEKDHKKLIHAFAAYHKENKNIELYILGTGELKDELTLLIENYGLQDKIHLVGQLENPFPLIEDCDCFILPSNHEGQPMVLLECLILNKPIIATDIPGNRSILEDGYGKIVENSVGGLVAGMEEIVNDRPVFKVFDYKNYNKEAMEMFYQAIEDKSFITK